MKIPVSKSRSRKGAALIEFAVIAPLLIILTVGLIELGRGITVKHVLSDAARHGCRYGIDSGTDNATLTTKVKSILTDNHLNADAATIKIYVNDAEMDVKTALRHDKIAVRVSIPNSEVNWLTPSFLTGNIVSEKMTMMRQN